MQTLLTDTNKLHPPHPARGMAGKRSPHPTGGEGLNGVSQELMRSYWFSYFIRLGKYRAKDGKSMTKPMAMASQTKKGRPAL